MAEIGKYHTLKVIKDLTFGLILDAIDSEILLLRKEVPAGVKIGDELEVFLYKDSENRPVATLRKPYIMLNQFACLEVMDVNKYGAFLNWGVENQLLVPFAEQPLKRLERGQWIVAMLYRDEMTDRLVATTKIEKYLLKDGTGLEEGKEVELLFYGKSPLGYKAVVEQKYIGLLHENEVFETIRTGDKRRGYIKSIRPDGKIDISIRKTGLEELTTVSYVLLNALEKNDGFLPLNDSSPPEEIRKELGLSKKSFKRASGMLYRDGKIELLPEGIRLKKTSPVASTKKVLQI